MEPIKVERSIWIDAPRERVWQAITTLLILPSGSCLQCWGRI